MKEGLKYIWKVLKKALSDFGSDNCFLFSAALSFYTLFSIAPAVLIAIYAAGLFMDDATIREEVIRQFQRLIGPDGAEGVKVLIDTVQSENQSIWSIIIGIIVIIVTATNIFVQVQNSFDFIFRVRPMKGKGFIKTLWDRAISLGMILSLGFVMIISLVMDTVIVSVTNYFIRDYKQLSAIFIAIGQNLIMLGIVYLVVYALFRFLADVVIKKSFIWKGSLVITVLLLVGKFGIGWYIGNSNFSELAGASASVIILMLWVYYSSFILFFGAELIKAQSVVSNVPIEAGRYAYRIRYQEIKEKE